MRTKDVFPGRYLKADDLDGNTLVTIKLVCMEAMRQDDGNDDDKPVIYFNEFNKGLPLNVTNWKACAVLYGDESNGWTGEKVILTSVTIDAFGKVTDAIRVRPPSKIEAEVPV